jgi:hypothetical protein
MNLSRSGLKVHDSIFPPVEMFLASFKHHFRVSKWGPKVLCMVVAFALDLSCWRLYHLPFRSTDDLLQSTE